MLNVSPKLLKDLRRVLKKHGAEALAVSRKDRGIRGSNIIVIASNSIYDVRDFHEELHADGQATSVLDPEDLF